MTESQLKHLHQLQDSFAEQVALKYAKGALEHGGLLWDKETAWLLDQAIDEAIDQYVYLMTMKEKLNADLR